MPGLPSAVLWIALVLAQPADAAERPATVATGTPSGPITLEQIQAAIGQLGDPDYRVRQEATDLLWQGGAASIEPLKQALKSDDPEVRYRAIAVLDKVRSGILPGTPPETLLLIDQFRHGGSTAIKQRALIELQGKGQWNTILALLRGEDDPQRRKELAAAMAAEAGKLVRPLVEQGEIDQALEVLELTAVHESGVVQLATALLLTDRLDPAIEQLRAKLTTMPTDDDWKRLAMFLRAKGELLDAVAAAEKTNDKYLVVNLLAEARQWGHVAPLVEELYKVNPSQPDHAAFAATFFRLAGDEAGYERMLAALKTNAGMQSAAGTATPGFPGDSVQIAKAWFVAETLLVNEQIDETLLLLRKTHPQHAHLVLWRQHRHGEALEYVGVTAEKTLDRAWFDALPTTPGDSRVQATGRIALAAQVARQLRELGRQQQAEQTVEVLRALADADNEQGRRWVQVAALNWQLGQYDESFADAAQAIAAKAPPTMVFSSLLKQQGALTSVWFDLLTTQNPLADKRAMIERAVWLSVANPPKEKLPAGWLDLLAKQAELAKPLQPPLLGQRFLTLGDTALVRGDRALARQYYEQAAVHTPSGAIKAADIAGGDGDWPAAARLYDQASQAAPGDPLALYLYGYAIAKDAAQAEAGAKVMRLAELMALSTESRTLLAGGLQERGLKEQAAKEFDLLRRTAPPDSSQVASAAQQVGNLVSSKDPLRAADCWTDLLLHVLNANSLFVEAEGYLTLPHVIHKVRAKGYLADGQSDEMLSELARCEKLLPGDVRLIEEFLPKLVKAGQKDAADLLFEQAFAVHKQIADEFPSSATYLNNAAWLAARSQRRLDEALPLVQKAIELAPAEAAYQDTLAEVHFQLGNREAAAAAAQKSVELAPGNKLFAKRLKHFQEGELKTLEGAEE